MMQFDPPAGEARSAPARSLVNWRETTLLFVLVLALVEIAFVFWVGFGDDAYIFGRYANNLVRGWGPAFNRGEPVEGYSSPLWLFLLSLMSLYKAPPMIAAGLLNALLWPALLLMAADDKKRWPAPLLLLLSGPIAFAAGNGLETGLMMTALLYGVWRQSRGDSRGATLGFAAVALTRPEGVLLALVALAEQARCERRLPLANLGIALAPWAAYLSFRLIYFQDVLPNTYYVKTQTWALFIETLPLYLGSLATYLPALPALLVIGAARNLGHLGGRNAASSPPKFAPIFWLPVELAGVLLLLSMAGGDDRLTLRYAAPALPLLAYAVAPRLSRPALALVAAATLAGSAIYLQQNLLMFVRANRQFVESARWLAQRVEPGAALATMYIGAVGYDNPDARVDDLLGVADRAIARRPADPDIHVRGHQKFDIPYSLARRPNYFYFWADADALPDRELRFRFVDAVAQRFLTDPAFRSAYRVADFFQPAGSVEGILFQRAAAEDAPAHVD